MRTMLVVPSEERSELSSEARLALWNHNPASRLVFHGPDETLDNSNAPMLPDGTEPWTNFLEAAPALEGAAPEDTVLVADQILGCGLGASDRPSKKPAHRD